MTEIDVYLYGMIAPSTVHILRSDFAFPDANGYAEVARTIRSIGGEAANSAIVLARLGLRTRLDGTWINREHVDYVTTTLAGYGIDVSRIAACENGGPDEWVIADAQSRTVFGTYVTLFDGDRRWNEPCEEDVAAAAIVCLDPFLGPSSRRAAEMCLTNGKRYVTQDSPCEDYIGQNAAAIAVSHELRERAYRDVPVRQLFERYLDQCRGLVVFTFGSDELWYGRGGACSSFRPFAIDPVDTTGAGDSFRGALAYGLLQDWPDERVVSFASAVAACVCTTYPHALNAPDVATVFGFLREHERATPW